MLSSRPSNGQSTRSILANAGILGDGVLAEAARELDVELRMRSRAMPAFFRLLLGGIHDDHAPGTPSGRRSPGRDAPRTYSRAATLAEEFNVSFCLAPFSCWISTGS